MWAYRRVGAWARRHARRGRVALLRDRRCKFGKFSFADYAAQLFILDCPIVDAFRTCNDGRAGAQPYPVTCADTPTRLRGGLDASSCHRFPERVNNLIHDCVERFARVNDDRVLRFLERGKLAFHQFLREKMG